MKSEREGKGPSKKVRSKPVGKKDRTGAGPLPISIPGMVVFNSKPGGGKSHLTRYEVYMNRKIFTHGVVFSKSVFSLGNLDYIPDYDGSEENKKKWLNFRHPRFDRAKLRAFLDLQASYPDNLRPIGFVIIDDEVSTEGMWNCEEMIDAATMYRHYNIVLFISTQYINKICTTVRECASQVALFAMDSKRAIEAAYESYGQEFDSYTLFNRWLKDRTEPEIVGRKHQFVWKDKMNGSPWEVCMAPPTIPHFRLEYGRRAKPKKCKRPKTRRAKPIPLGPFAKGLGELAGEVTRRSSGEPYEDSWSHPSAFGYQKKQ